MVIEKYNLRYIDLYVCQDYPLAGRPVARCSRGATAPWRIAGGGLGQGAASCAQARSPLAASWTRARRQGGRAGPGAGWGLLGGAGGALGGCELASWLWHRPSRKSPRQHPQLVLPGTPLSPGSSRPWARCARAECGRAPPHSARRAWMRLAIDRDIALTLDLLIREAFFGEREWQWDRWHGLPLFCVCIKSETLSPLGSIIFC